MNVREVALRANEEAAKLCELLLPAGKRVGKQWIIGDASGAAGDSMAVELDGPKRGQWYDHAAGIGGDMLKLVEVNRNLTPIKASDEVRKLLGLPAWTPEKKNGPPPAPEYDPCSKSWMVKSINQWVAPSKAWAYRNAAGKVLAYVCRIDWEEGGKRKKDVIPQRLGDDGKWHWKGYKGDEKRPLYGLEFLLKLNDGRALMIVEGEKTCDAARKHFPGIAVVTWMGGCKNVQKAEWGPVQHWKGPVVVWPDNDDEGQTAALYLCSRLPNARKVVLPDGLPAKWDLADPIPEGISIRGLLDAAIAPPVPPQLKTKAEVDAKAPFITLGLDESGYYFLNRAEGFLLHYTPSNFTELGIFRIAPDTYWEGMGFYRDRSNKVDYQRAAKYLMEDARRKGGFDPSRVRGRGVWMDDGRVVIHLGDRLIVDNVPTDFVDLKSEYLYPKRPAIRNIDFKNPLTKEQSIELLYLLEKCTWQKARSAYLLAGFIVCAMVPGILDWRPHFFLRGESSAGKTWAVGHIIYPLLQELSRTFMAVASSEAGIRQAMLIDALTVILDEFDADHGHSVDMMEAMMGLARQSSSDTGGAGVKGTQEGNARYYSLKSAFLFVGTADAIKMKADESRITRVELRKASGEDNKFNFAEIQSMAAATTENQSWCAQFRGRILTKVRELLASVKVFRAVASRLLRDTRAGDQTGTLLAGAWMCFNDVPPTIKEAEGFMGAMDWDDTIPTEADSDHAKCLKAFTAFRVDYDDGGNRRMETVGRLIEKAMDTGIVAEASDRARRGLEQFGIRVEFDRVFVAENHRGTSFIFAKTPFADKWRQHFLRLPHSEAGECSISITRYRGVWLNIKSFK